MTATTTIPTPTDTREAHAPVTDRRAIWALRLGIAALAIGWIPLIGWFVGAALLVASVVLGYVVQFSTGQTPTIRKSLLINVVAGVLMFLSIWAVMNLGADPTAVAALPVMA